MAFSFERKILKSSDLQEQVRINDIIMSCHLFSSEKNNNNDNKKPQQLSSLKKHKHSISLAGGHFLATTFVLGKRLLKGIGPGGWVRNCVTSGTIRRERSKELSVPLCASSGEGLVKG